MTNAVPPRPSPTLTDVRTPFLGSSGVRMRYPGGPTLVANVCAPFHSGLHWWLCPLLLLLLSNYPFLSYYYYSSSSLLLFPVLLLLLTSTTSTTTN
jgi:hypothetical protein